MDPLSEPWYDIEAQQVEVVIDNSWDEERPLDSMTLGELKYALYGWLVNLVNNLIDDRYGPL